MQSSSLFNLPIINVSRLEAFAYFARLLTSVKKPGKALSIFTPNPEQIVMAFKQPDFARALQRADYLLPDGVGLIFASRLLHFFGKLEQSLAERIAGVELVEYLLQEMQKNQQSALIIGGRDYSGSFSGEAFEDERSLVELRPGLFWTEGYQEKAEILPVEEQALEKIIAKLQPTVVFVALGAPDQEKWILKHQKVLDKNGVRLSIAVGGSFDFIFGKVVRAPKFLQNLGLEWFWRLAKQPWRWRRQLRLLDFIALTVKELFR